VNFGLRTDGNTYTETGNDLGRTISPRLALAYTLAPGWTLNASVGRYYKIQPYTILGYEENGVPVNRDADYIQSDHFVGGIEYTPTNAARITLEAFRKNYDNYPVSERRNISMANLGGDFGVFGNERVITNGKGRTWGVEFTYQQQLVKNVYGILAYTWYYSEFTGLDRSTYLPSAWDNRHLVSFTGGYKFPRNWEVGIRFRYQGEAPYTPYDEFASLENYPFTGQGVLNDALTNTLRLDGFNAMDLRVDKKWNFKGWSLNLFLDVQNLYNSLNPSSPGFTLDRNEDGSIATTTGAPYNPGSYENLQAPNNRQDAIPVYLPRDSGSRLPSVGFVVAF
jgi:outer membrane receptor for ferrienterochelin and colicin